MGTLFIATQHISQSYISYCLHHNLHFRPVFEDLTIISALVLLKTNTYCMISDLYIDAASRAMTIYLYDCARSLLLYSQTNVAVATCWNYQATE